MGQTLPRSDEYYMFNLVLLTMVIRPKWSAKDAATRLGLSRRKAQYFLAKARERTEVLFDSEMQRSDTLNLAGLVSSKYEKNGVREVIVVPTCPDDESIFDAIEYRDYVRRALGHTAAQYVMALINRDRVKDGHHICVEGGRTMLNFADKFRAHGKRILFRPLSAGGRWRAVEHPDAATVLQIILTKNSLRIPGPKVICPEAPPDEISRVRTSPEVGPFLGTDPIQPRITLCTLPRTWYGPGRGEAKTPRDKAASPQAAPASVPLTGTYVRLVVESLLFQKLSEAQRMAYAGRIHEPLPVDLYRCAARDLLKKRVMGGIARYGIDEKGNVVTGLLEKTSLAIHPDKLRQWRKTRRTETIVIAAGAESAPLMDTVLGNKKGSYFSVAIIDAALAVQLVHPAIRPAEFRTIRRISKDSWRDHAGWRYVADAPPTEDVIEQLLSHF